MIDESKPIFTLRDGIVSPRFIASADIHLGHKLYNIPDLEEDHRDNFVRLCDLAIQKKVDYLVIAGDLFEDNLPKPGIVAFVKEQVERLKKEKIDVIGVAGDHDKPIQGQTWCNISGIYPPPAGRHFAGVDYFIYSVGLEHVIEGMMEGLRNWKVDPKDVYWLILHAQFPNLFQFSEDKKKIDFTNFDLFNVFPNLQGVVAGDIHMATEGVLVEKNIESYIGYCGSLGITDMTDANQDKSVIYCDGHQLFRLPFVQRRDFIKVEFRGDNYEAFNAKLYDQWRQSEHRPIFSIEWDADSEPFLGRLKPLYEIGFVRTHQVIRNLKTGNEETIVNVRSEMKTDEKIEAALKKSCGDDLALHDFLAEAIAAEDPKITLDALKEKAQL